jgi:hypothetical protein
MASDYSAIRADNREEYGKGIGRIGRMLLTDRYDERTHFIYELLQNAEDALGRRGEWAGSRTVTFTLSSDELRVSHFGYPFDLRDVRCICGIAEGTKESDLTSIGRFGIGFKSVYAFTDRPEVHSGDEDFAIETFVLPTAVPTVDRGADETVFVLPFRNGDSTAPTEIAEGLRALGSRALLFLRQIDEIKWVVNDREDGFYCRGEPEQLDEDVRRVVLLGEEREGSEVDEAWLLFSREARTLEGKLAGHVEIAFSTTGSEGKSCIEGVPSSPLVVFFPTVIETHFGFLVQGPYRTTPSRDNVPRTEPWNQYLVEQTSALLLDALRWLRDREQLDVATLRTLPLNAETFGANSMFSPVFDAVRAAVKTDDLLPAFAEGYAAAEVARIARTQELRELLDAEQLGLLLGSKGPLVWLTAEITQDRAPDLREYLINELEVVEVTPESILPKLTSSFLSDQSDEWMLRLYEFLNGQQSLRSQPRLASLPLVRLDNGTQVAAQLNGEPQAFLPGSIETDFPTVRPAVCSSEKAEAFLRGLGITEPDPVDDVIRNVLPAYRRDEVDVTASKYEKDVQRLVAAFETDSKTQREKLVAALRESTFVAAVDPGDRQVRFVRPQDVYLATERLTELFAGVAGVLLVDDSHAALRGEAVRELLEACGASRYLELVSVETEFSNEELRKIWQSEGCTHSTGPDRIEDRTLRGLGNLLSSLPSLETDVQLRKAALLWEALADVEDRRGANVFSGIYQWFYYHVRRHRFDSHFVRWLNEVAWVPDDLGHLQAPGYVAFESLNWEQNPFLLSKIRFKPPVIEALAQEAGIEPGVLDLLTKLGVRSVDDLLSHLRPEDDGSAPEHGANEPSQASGSSSQPTESARPSSDLASSGGGVEASVTNGGQTASTGSSEPRDGSSSGHTEGHADLGGDGSDGRTASTPSPDNGSSGTSEVRAFISYVAAHPDDEADPDELAHEERMALEEKAIRFILDREPQLQRTPTGNPGFDLIETDEAREVVRWIEVKAMTSDLTERPVGLSKLQFEAAREHGSAYWLYVVERAADEAHRRVIRIQDPWGKARTFTFDQGWLNAKVSART